MNGTYAGLLALSLITSSCVLRPNVDGEDPHLFVSPRYSVTGTHAEIDAHGYQPLQGNLGFYGWGHLSGDEEEPFGISDVEVDMALDYPLQEVADYASRKPRSPSPSDGSALEPFSLSAHYQATTEEKDSVLLGISADPGLEDFGVHARLGLYPLNLGNSGNPLTHLHLTYGHENPPPSLLGEVVAAYSFGSSELEYEAGIGVSVTETLSVWAVLGREEEDTDLSLGVGFIF